MPVFCLQQPVSTRLCPSHLLVFDHPFTDNLVHGRFHEGRGDGFAVPVAIAVVGDEGTVNRDVMAEFRNGLVQLGYF